MKQSSVRFLNMLLSLLLLVATIFVYSLLLKPAYEEVNQLRGDLASKSELLTETRKIVDKVKELLDKYQTLAGPRADIAPVLPTKEEYPNLVAQVSGLARASRLDLDSVSFNLSAADNSSAVSGSATPVLGVIQISLNLRGSYQSLQNFLKTVETNVRIMDVTKLSFSPAIGGGDNFSYNVVVETYYQTL